MKPRVALLLLIAVCVALAFGNIWRHATRCRELPTA
jgi:hypothetical protein